MLAALALAAAAACSPDTVPQPKTLFHGVFSAFHFDEGGGDAQVKGQSFGTMEGRLSMAFCRWPEYTLSIVGRGHPYDIKTGETTANGVTSPRYAQLGSSGYEIQRRWRDSSVFHPIVGFGIGSAKARNYIYTQATATSYGRYQYTEEGRSTYYEPSVGLEASLFKYMTMYAIVGSRFGGNMNIPGLGPGDLSGKYSIVGFGFGKFR